MSELIRSFDWSATGLGPIAAWATPLRNAVSVMLAAQHPVCLFWGPDLRCLYNDAVRAMLGDEEGNRSILGAPAATALAEAWPIIGPELEGVLAGGPATWHVDRLIPTRRNGRVADAWWTYSFSPLHDEAAPTGVGGVLAFCTETTEAVLTRKDTERRVFESEARFREIANAAPVMIWVADEDAACTWLNEPWLGFSGRPADEQFGNGWLELVHPCDLERTQAIYSDAYATRRPFRMDFRLRRHDGEWRVVDNTGVPRLGENGAFLGFIGACTDVTRHRETEARFRGVFNAELMGMTVFDANTRETLAINDRFLAMTGHSRADFDAGRWSREDVNLPEFAPLDEAAIAQARHRGWWDPFEKEMRRRDGTRCPVRVSSAPLPGQPGRVVIAIQDITAERAAQAALIASEERLRLGLEAGRMVTWEFDLRTGEISRSANAEVIFGSGPDFDDFSKRMPEEDVHADQERLQAALADPEGFYQSEFRYRHPDGRLLYLHNQGRVKRDASGAPVRMHGVCVDITERKAAEEALKLLNETLEQQVEARTTELLKAEDALRQSQKMEALGHLTGGVAHDFNNLLGAVVGSFDLIRRRVREPERVRQLAEAGLKAAERGAKLTSQLLTFSRAQRIELNPVVVAEVVDGMRDMLCRALGPIVALRVEVACGGASVLSDATQLEMAVLNLAINARDAMPDGGELVIATRPRTIDRDPALARGRYVELSVSDTGSGMTPDVAARAFDPFFTTKGVGKGTGLGLSQVYGIARQGGGTVLIDSAPGQGTTVRILLPCTEPAPQAGSHSAASVAGGPKPTATVLVVDDDPDLRQVLVASLEALGYGVMEAQDGPTGLSVIERERLDLAIVDFAMPGMTGAELAKAARTIRPDLPILFASGYADTDAIHDVAGPGARVLRKPFRVDELQVAVAAALAGSGG